MRRLCLGLFRWAVALYYRRVELGGKVPAAGPVLLVANHPNGLVDPVLLTATTSRPVRFLGKAPLFEMPVIGSVMRGIDALPVYRAQDGADTAQNRATFGAVYAALGAGELVCLFPEGRSHDEPALAKLKTGAARMALGAEAERGFALGVRIVPVGLVYRAKSRFRSSVAVWIGAPIECADLAALHARDEREAVHVLTERIAAGLRAVTLDLERWEDLPLLDLAERIHASADVASGGEAARFARLTAFAAGLHELRSRDPAAVAALSARVASFRARLARLGLDAEDLPERLERRTTRRGVLRFALANLARLAVGLPLAVAGKVFWFVPYRAVPWIARPFAATAAVLATGRILAALLLFPLWLAALAALAARASPWAAALVVVLAPALGLFALAFRDWRAEIRDEAQVFLRLAARSRLRAHLARERAELARAIDGLRERLENPAGIP